LRQCRKLTGAVAPGARSGARERRRIGKVPLVAMASEYITGSAGLALAVEVKFSEIGLVGKHACHWIAARLVTGRRSCLAAPATLPFR
jgi:hypothetical protein